MPTTPPGEEGGGDPSGGGPGAGGAGVGAAKAAGSSGIGAPGLLPVPLVGIGTPFTTRRLNRNNELNQATAYATARELDYGVPVDELPFTAGQGFELLDPTKPLNTEPVTAPETAAPSAEDERRGTTPMPGRALASKGDPFAGMGKM